MLCDTEPLVLKDPKGVGGDLASLSHSKGAMVCVEIGLCKKDKSPPKNRSNFLLTNDCHCPPSFFSFREPLEFGMAVVAMDYLLVQELLSYELSFCGGVTLMCILQRDILLTYPCMATHSWSS